MMALLGPRRNFIYFIGSFTSVIVFYYFFSTVGKITENIGIKRARFYKDIALKVQTHINKLTVRGGGPELQDVRGDMIQEDVPNPINETTANLSSRPSYVTSKKEFLILQWVAYQNITIGGLKTANWKVKNCKITSNRTQLNSSDAIVISTLNLRSITDLPNHRSPWQRWVMMHDDHPYHIRVTKRWKLEQLDGIFNWTMTYKMDSDVPIPYGWKEKRTSSVQVDNFAERHKNDKKKSIVAAMISSCNPSSHNDRMGYVKRLMKHIPVDVYGACGNFTCPGRYVRTCKEIQKYKFYLAFENNNCNGYITEKLWSNAFQNEVVPVVMGPPKKDYLDQVPPNSVIHVDDFKSPAHLAEYLKILDGNSTEYNEYFKWKKDYKTFVRAQFLTYKHWETLCDKLNSAREGEVKTHKKISQWFNPENNCISKKWP
ncbi:unnamed protein product [Owenia fusiformis]|uniref:Fucosyltransferase n=1 Tax=Owenia fusiformis TaxID=6347 RepID=A0A8J1TYV6_OWEFU|nr:unnamed protein product [Owenia fusiformis]CAH1802710.1 unnamed protein product [Owenia fusiformis]